MKEPIIQRLASPDEISFYCYLGEALIKTQVVEQALNCSITMKMHKEATEQEADVFLSKNLRYTLGMAIKVVEKENLYPLSLQNELKAFLDQRNWLVHKVIVEGKIDVYTAKKNDLFSKIKSISNEAMRLHLVIEDDMIDFSELQGRDMSKFRAMVKEKRKQGMTSHG